MTSNTRLEERSNVFLAASLDTGTKSAVVRVRNLSPSGAMLDGPALPPEGTRVRLKRGALSAVGLITWSNAFRAGLRFDSKLNVKLWTKPVGHKGQCEVDQVVASYRAGKLSQNTPTTQEPPSLQLISSMLDQICERMAGLPAVAVDAGEELLRLDVVAQHLRRAATR
jgi:hypothetical protein